MSQNLLYPSLAAAPVSTLAGHHEGGDDAVAAEQMGDDAVWASGARAVVAEVEGEVIAVVFTEALVLSLKEV